jgi:hypothetical protein
MPPVFPGNAAPGAICCANNDELPATSKTVTRIAADVRIKAILKAS